MEKHDEQIDQEQQQQQTVIEQEDDMMTLIPKKNEQQDEYNFEKEGKLMEVFSRPVHNSGDEEKDDFPSPSPCKIARHETPDLSSASEAVALNKGHYDDLAEENDEQHQQKTTTTINKCDPTEFSTSSSCLNLSLSTSDSSSVVPKDAENNFEDKINDKNSLDISSYTLMFPDTTRHGSISTAPITNNGQVQNILVLNLPPGVNAVLSDQPSETQENVLMAPPDIGQQPAIQEVTNLSSSSSPTSSTCTSTTQVACDTTTKNLINGVDPDDSKTRKCSIIEPNNTSRVKFLSQVTPESYVFNPTDQNLIQKNSLSAAFSSVSSSTPLKSDDLGRSLNSSNLEVENWQKFRDHSKENSPTSILNGMQGFGPLANHIPISSYILDSNQMISEPPPQISQDPTMQATHQVCTLAASQIGGSQIQNTPHPKYGQLTFCHNGLIPQPPMKKEEEKPCPLNYLQSMNPNYNATVSRKTSSLLCLKSNLANSKENDPTRHLHNLNERKRRARITIACDFMRKLVPGLSDKTDKATVFEYAARYIHFLNAQVGKEYDANFLVKYCNY